MICRGGYGGCGLTILFRNVIQEWYPKERHIKGINKSQLKMQSQCRVIPSVTTAFLRKKSGTEKRRFYLFILLIPIISLTACGQSKVGNDEQKAKKNNQAMNPYYSTTDTAKLILTDAEWKEVLPDEVYQVSRHAETERPFTGKYVNTDEIGTYYCAACGNRLFRSTAKFSSGCGWPSFFEQDNMSSIIFKRDRSHGMERVEALCGRCDGHLGHLFEDGPPPTGKRYCMNSIVLDFIPDKK